MKFLVYVLSTLLIFSYVRTQEPAINYNIDRQDLDISDIENDPEVVGALKEGINWVFGKAAEKYGISDRDIDVTKVNKAQRWQDNQNNYYFFDVEAENADASVNSTYNVRCLDSGEFKVVNEWNYTIDEKNDNQEEAVINYDDNNDNGEEDIESELPDADTNVELELELENECVEENQNRCAEGTEVDSDAVNTDEGLRDALSHGIKWIFQKANEKFGIDNSVINVDEVNLICEWEKNGDTYYHFEVEASNNDDDKVEAAFNVKREGEGDSGNAGDLSVVNEWTYNIDYPEDNQEDENDSYVEESEAPGTDVYQDANEENSEVVVVYEDPSDDNSGTDNTPDEEEVIEEDIEEDETVINYPDNTDNNDEEDAEEDVEEDETVVNYPDNDDDDNNDDNSGNNNDDNNDDDNNGDETVVNYPDPDEDN